MTAFRTLDPVRTKFRSRERCDGRFGGGDPSTTPFRRYNLLPLDVATGRPPLLPHPPLSSLDEVPALTRRSRLSSVPCLLSSDPSAVAATVDTIPPVKPAGGTPSPAPCSRTLGPQGAGGLITVESRGVFVALPSLVVALPSSAQRERRRVDTRGPQRPQRPSRVRTRFAGVAADSRGRSTVRLSHAAPTPRTAEASGVPLPSPGLGLVLSPV